MKSHNPQSWRRHLHYMDPNAEDVPEFLEVDDGYIDAMAELDSQSEVTDGPRNYIPACEPK